MSYLGLGWISNSFELYDIIDWALGKLYMMCYLKLSDTRQPNDCDISSLTLEVDHVARKWETLTIRLVQRGQRLYYALWARCCQFIGLQVVFECFVKLSISCYALHCFCISIRVSCITVKPSRTRDIDPMLDQCWASVVDGGPTLVQHWVDVLLVTPSIVTLKPLSVTIIVFNWFY